MIDPKAVLQIVTATPERKIGVCAIAFLFVISLAGFFIFKGQILALVAQRHSLEQQLAQTKYDLEIERFNAAMKDRAMHMQIEMIGQLEAENADLKERQQIKQEAVAEVQAAPATDDGPVASVLKKGMGGVKRVLKKGKP